MLIVRQCWLLFFYSGIGLPFAGVYSIKYEDDSNRTTVQSRQLQSGFFPSEFNQNNNYNDNSGNYNDNNYDGNNLNYNGNSGNYNGNYNPNTNYDFNPNSQYQAGNTLQFPSNDNPPTNSPPLNVQAQDNSVFNTGEYYNVDQQQPQQFNNNDVQYFAYQDPQLSTFANNKQPVTSYYQPSHTFQPNLQNAPPPQRVTQRPIGPFQRPQRPQPQRPQPQRPQRPLGPVNNIPQPAGYYQQNYAGNFNNYQQTTSNPISNFISNIGQGAADFFNGGPNSNYFSGPNGPPPPQQFDSFNRPIRPNGGRPPPPNGGRPPLPPQSPFGTIEQLGKAIDEITRNDDFQCIPKVICQMFGNQRQQSSYSSILGSPIFSGLIAAVPSSSTGLVYGRAALLGYTSGEHTCNGAYPKCPKNEDDLLYYLNNHRGGFFRFFNGGASFGDDTNYNYNQHNNQQNHYPNNQYNQNYNQQQTAPQQSSISNLAALQNLADTINQSDGINLSNLASNGGLLSNLAGLVGGGTGGGNGAADLLSLIGSGAASGGGGNGAADLLSLIGGGAASGGGASGILNSLISGGNGVASSSQASDANSVGPISLLSGLGGLAQNGGSAANIGSVVGNLLTGFIGNRFSSRKISKRSVAEGIANEEGKSVGKVDDEAEAENATISGGSGNQTDELSDIEPRIVHGKVPILSSLNEPTNSNIKFVDENENENVYRDRKQIKFNENHDDEDTSDNNSKKSFFKFPSNDIGKQNENVIFPPSSSSNDPFRTSKKIKFQQQTDSDPHFFPAISDDGDHHQSLNEIDDTSHRRIKMVFPDRTGTGNLIFDNKEFDTDSTRIGRILTGLRVLQQLEQIQQLSGNTNRIPFDATNKYNGNRYESNSNIYANPLYSLAQSNGGYQQSSSPNRYTTNQQAINHRFGNQNYNINYNSQSSYDGGGGTTYSGNDDTSQNVYVTNGQGVVEYYINKAGVKVYV